VAEEERRQIRIREENQRKTLEEKPALPTRTSVYVTARRLPAKGTGSEAAAISLLRREDIYKKVRRSG